MDQLRSVVVGIDFSAASAAALAQAARIASWNRAAVHAVHIVNTLVMIEPALALAPLQVAIQENLVADAERDWAGFQSRHAAARGLPLHVEVNNGPAGLLASARAKRADLLVVGACGSDAPHVGLGTFATASVRGTPGRTLVVQERRGAGAGSGAGGAPEGADPFRRVVACVDFSPASMLALEEALRIAMQDGAAVHALHVIGQAGRLPRGVTAATLRAAAEEELRRFCARFTHEARYAKPTCEVVEASGHRSAISEFAERTGADLVVLGTRGQSNLRDLLIGSTAEKVLRDVRCSILAVAPR